jgi:hypothetical protein
MIQHGETQVKKFVKIEIESFNILKLPAGEQEVPNYAIEQNKTPS